MKRSTISIIIVVGILLLLVFWAIGKYNNIITKDETTKEKWANVESAYQRRLNLIPNILTIVESAADFEKETLTAVVEARSKATSLNVDVNDLNPEKIQQFQAAQSQLSGALSRLLVTVERYPQLTATQGYLSFQDQYEGTENRIKREVDLFNKSVKEYNVSIRTFPGNIVAGFGGFEKKGSFEAETGAEKAPDINELKKRE